MSFMPGDLVRRAAAGVTSTVSSTVSSVAQVASGKRRHDSHGGRQSFYESNLLTNAKEKYTMTVKCTPNKDAATTADLAVKSGFLMKRNEQGVWQKRFMCIVPHMYLYYFDTELAEAPRGVIDLELYQNIEREENGGIKLVAGEESLRSFHFNDEDDENLNEWATSLIRDRYHLVCEERNAYQQMQSLMTGAIDNASSAQKISEKEREQLEQQYQQMEKSFLEARTVLQNTVVEFGISDEEMSQLTDVHKIGVCLKSRISDIRNTYERKLAETQELMHNQQVEYGKMTEDFLKKMENEQIARKNLEALILKERKDAEKKVKEAEAQIDNITLNFQMAVAAKTSSETKVNTLNDQKKLLVKEVKQLRKRVDELTASNEEMKSLNDRLLKAASALQNQVKSSGTSSPKTLPNENLSSPVGDEISENEPVSAKHGSATESSNPELEDLLNYTDQLIAKSENLSHASAEHGRSFDANSDDSRSPSSSSSHPIHRAMNMFRGGSETEQERHMSDEKSRNDSVDDSFEERPSWEMPPMALRELGWLSEEQNKLMERRLNENKEQDPGVNNVSPAAFKRSAGDEPHESDGRRGSALSMLTGGFLGNASTPESANSRDSGRRSSLMSITSMFRKEKAQGPALTLDESLSPSQPVQPVSSNPPPPPVKPSDDLFFSSPFSSQPEDESDRLPTAMRLHCLRCNGTVEGPKFSTCKCANPALTPDELTSDRLTSLTGMIRGGISWGRTGSAGGKGSAGSNSQNEISL